MHVCFKSARLLLSLIYFSTGFSLAPFASGTVYGSGLAFGKFRANGTVIAGKSWQLSKDQLAALNSWVGKLLLRLSMTVGSSPLPSYSVILSDARGQRIQIDLYTANERWRHALQFRAWDNGGRFKYAVDTVGSDAELAALKELLKKRL